MVLSFMISVWNIQTVVSSISNLSALGWWTFPCVLCRWSERWVMSAFWWTMLGLWQEKNSWMLRIPWLKRRWRSTLWLTSGSVRHRRTVFFMFSELWIPMVSYGDFIWQIVQCWVKHFSNLCSSCLPILAFLCMDATVLHRNNSFNFIHSVFILIDWLINTFRKYSIKMILKVSFSLHVL